MTDRDPLLKYIKDSQVRTAFVIGTICSCGILFIPWIIWEIVRRK